MNAKPSSNESFQTATVPTPIGPVTLIGRGAVLVGVEFADLDQRIRGLRRHLERSYGRFEARSSSDPAGAATRLRAYCAGDLAALEDQPIELNGTPFQRAVWEMLRTIPVGHTWSYGQLAAKLGRPSAVRAVGAANGRNPIALFVPCHRVVAADGSLWGYGGGLERKRWLLDHERAAAPRVGRAQRELALT